MGLFGECGPPSSHKTRSGLPDLPVSSAWRQMELKSDLSVY